MSLVAGSVLCLGATPPARVDTDKIKLDKHVEDIFKEGKGKWRDRSKKFSVDSKAGDTETMLGVKSDGKTLCSATVSIQPTVGSSGVSHNLVKGHREGYVVAKIVNQSSVSDDCTVLKYRIKPGATVWWVVELGQNDNIYKSRFVDEGSPDDQESETPANNSKKYFSWEPCGPHEPANVDVAKITYRGNGCKISLTMVPKLAPVVVKSGQKLMPFDDDSRTFWFSCSETCCYADL